MAGLKTTSPASAGNHRLASRWGPWGLGLLLVAATLLAYLPAWHAGFVWEDAIYVTGNPLLTAPDGLRRIWFTLDSPSQYFPLTYTWLRFEHGLWGLQPAGYHGMNVALHAANALMLWRLLKRLAVPGAWLAAALFALHPVQVESVASISELKNVLMLFFYLLAVWAWVEFIERPAEQGQRYYLLALGLSALALCAKTTACTLPVTLLLILWLKRKPMGWVRLAQTAPFFGLSLGMGLLTMWWERNHQGTQGTLFAMSWLQRLLIASHAFWFYLGKLIWPANLTFIYPRWTLDVADVSDYLWLAAAVALGAVIYLTRRFQGRGLAAALIFFAVTLGPVMGFIMLYTFRYTYVADHYQYVACIGPLALAAAWLTVGLDRLGPRPAWAKAVLPAALLAGLGVLTWRQCGMYANGETLWRTTLARNPDCELAENNLGDVLARQGKQDEAIGHYERALELNPDEAQPHFNLGNVLARQGKLDEAIQHYERALQLDPGGVAIHVNCGNALARQGKLNEAVQHYERALQLDPANADAHCDLAVALARQGKSAQAILHLQQAIQANPDYAQAHCDLGIALAAERKLDEAIQHYERAIQLDPDYANAHFNLGLALAGQGRAAEASQQFEQALQLAVAQGNAALAESIRARLKSYQSSKP